jgi:hypothetical protein
MGMVRSLMPTASSSDKKSRRKERDFRHFESHRDCYYEPRCLRCWAYAFADLLLLAVRQR